MKVDVIERLSMLTDVGLYRTREPRRVESTPSEESGTPAIGGRADAAGRGAQLGAVARASEQTTLETMRLYSREGKIAPGGAGPAAAEDNLFVQLTESVRQVMEQEGIAFEQVTTAELVEARVRTAATAANETSATPIEHTAERAAARVVQTARPHLTDDPKAVSELKKSVAQGLDAAVNAAPAKAAPEMRRAKRLALASLDREVVRMRREKAREAREAKEVESRIKRTAY